MDENLILYFLGCYWKLNFYPKINGPFSHSQSHIIRYNRPHGAL